jgi:thiopeptide-type bacteriocin biosynthesis protein
MTEVVATAPEAARLPKQSEDIRQTMMLRAPLLPLERFVDIFARPMETEAQLLALFNEPVFREALWIASPTLARDLEMLELEPLPPKRYRSLIRGLARYAIRATTRPTPFGGFAGIGAMKWQEGDIRSSTCGVAQTYARLDYREVMKFVKLLERDSKVRANLRFFANPAAYRWGERMRLGYRDAYAQGDSTAHVSLRVTEVVDKVFAWAQTPMRYGELLVRFQADYPKSTPAQIDAFLQTMIEQQLLLSTLRPPLTVADPLAYVIGELPTESRDDTTTHLRQLQRQIAAYNDCPLGAGVTLLQDIYARLGYAFGSRQCCLQIDMRLGELALNLSTDVVPEIKRAAEALARLFADSFSDPLAGYRREFLERYGEREVPLLELLDEETGLGPLPGYHHPPATRPWPPVEVTSTTEQARRRYLSRLVAEAYRTGAREVVLDEDELAARFPLPKLSATDVLVTVLAQDAASARRGAVTLVLSAIGGAYHGDVYGRFAHLEPAFRAHLQALANDEVLQHPDVIFADLTYAAQEGHVNNVSIHPALYPHEIAVATTPGVPFSAHVPLNDLYVGVQAGRFYLRSRKLNREVVIRAPHLLNKTLAPNAVRFLQDIADLARPTVPAWHWIPFQDLPYLPRIRLGRVVLAPARWRLSEELIRSEQDDWGERLAAWRSAWKVPRYIYAGQLDNRLLLDLEHPLCLELLYSLVKQGTRTIEEALWEAGLGCATDAEGQRYVSELVIPYLPEDPVLPSRVTLAPRLIETSLNERQLLPGQGCLYFKLYGPASHQDEVLVALRDALAGRTLTWFFVRYRDPEAHLRFRILAASEVLMTLLPQVLAVLERLRLCGYLARVQLDTYERELERYGGVAAMPICEAIFAVDSAMVLVLKDIDRRPVTDLALASVDVFLRGLGLAQSERHALYVALDDGYSAERASDPSYAAQVKSQANADRKRVWELLHAIEKGALAQWRVGFIAALKPQVEALQQQVVESATCHPFSEIAASLAHMHANRLGLNRQQEHRAIAALRRAYDGFGRFVPEGVTL